MTDRQETPAGTGRISMTMVAKLAGVSQKTVSRVVNGEPHVTREVQERVREAIRTSGYHRNAAARALVTKRTHRIGAVACSNAFHGPGAQLTAAESAVRSAGYTLTVTRAGSAEPGAIQEAIDRVADDGVEGILLVEPMDLNGATLHAPQGAAVLTFGTGRMTDAPDEQLVGRDEAAGARDATEHLLALGHATVHHIAGPPRWIASTLRADGWRMALRDSDAMAPDPIVGDWTPHGGFDAMNRLLDDATCTAVFVANDQMAVGAMRAIQMAGRRVPEDISIVGFDDLDIAAYLSTPLTTVQQDFDESARIGVHRLIRAIEGHEPSSTVRLVPAPLIVRSSTARPHGSAPQPGAPLSTTP